MRAMKRAAFFGMVVRVYATIGCGAVKLEELLVRAATLSLGKRFWAMSQACPGSRT
jgi:hypothetical protein